MLALKTHHLTCHRRCTNQSRPLRRTRTAFRPCAIGFDLAGSSTSISAEKSADGLSRAASSLLMYRGVLSSGTARSFMEVLLHLQKGSPLRLLEHYGELYKSINNEGYSSWQDYLLDQVLRGTDNPFSKAAARGEPTTHLIPSVRHDLTVIQQLSVSEATLAGWVRETVNGISNDWITAATSMPPNLAEDDSGARQSFEIPQDPPAHILAPLTKSQRAQLRSDLSQRQPAEAAVLLQRYQAAHDYGILSTHRVLKWSQDRLQAQDVLEGVAHGLGDGDQSTADAFAAALHAGLLSLNLSNRKQGCDPIFIKGGSRKAYSLAMYVLNNLTAMVPTGNSVAAASVRTVILPETQLSTISELAWTMSQHPRMYFAVVCPGMPEEVSNDVAATVAGRDGVSWPANAVFIGCLDTPSVFSKIPGLEIELSGKKT